MKISGSCAGAIFAGSIVIAACSQTTDFSRLPYTPNADSTRNNTASGYRVLHSFGEGHDGSAPNGLIAVGDTFYGTTGSGGSHYCGKNYGGCGTVFSMTADGKEHVLYSFGNKNDGADPGSDLTDVHGVLYGTTNNGGAYGYGTAFSITLDGKEKVLHSFGAPSDGRWPSDLIDVGGVLYGTTFGGGTGCAQEGCGIVFSITTDGKEHVLYSFDDSSDRDGWYPSSGLTDVRGTLYATTYNGGLYGQYEEGWGTFFSVTTNGKEKVLHSFGKGNDGWYPDADLTKVDGVLYGVTQGGGASYCREGYGGCGTVFSVTTDGKERVLRSFNGTDGSYPVANLINIGGTLYGTTRNGGGNQCSSTYGTCGTVFSITTNGTEKVLHSFRKPNDGWYPVAPLTYKSGSIFGTTRFGGVYGGGVVFSMPLTSTPTGQR